MNVYAYARVSARDQNLDRQIEAFTAFGVEKSRIFCDKKSGRDFDRSGYKKMFARLRRGDLLVVKSIDRLGRNYEMIIEEWRAITEKKGADILVLDMPVLDTRSKDGAAALSAGSYQTWCCRCCRSWRRTREKTCAHGRRRAYAAQRREECASADRAGYTPPR